MKFAIVTALLMFSAQAAHAQAAHAQQRTLEPNKELAESGKKVFAAKGCSACHTMGKGTLIGPDLSGVMTRRSTDWIERWLHDPPAMLATDSAARALRKEFSVDMPNLGLTKDEIVALMQYLALQSKSAK